MQLLHFSFGVGSTFSPAVVGLVLLVAPLEAQLLWCYWVLGCLVMGLSLSAIWVPSPAPVPALKPTLHASAKEPESLPNWLSRLIVALTAFSLFTYVGVEVAYGGWIFTYAVKVFGMGETEADYLSSAFWGAITLGRLLAVPLAARLSSSRLLLADHLGSTLAIVLALLIIPSRNNLVRRHRFRQPFSSQ